MYFVCATTAFSEYDLGNLDTGQSQFAFTYTINAISACNACRILVSVFITFWVNLSHTSVSKLILVKQRTQIHMTR